MGHRTRPSQAGGRLFAISSQPQSPHSTPCIAFGLARLRDNGVQAGAAAARKMLRIAPAFSPSVLYSSVILFTYLCLSISIRPIPLLHPMPCLSPYCPDAAEVTWGLTRQDTRPPRWRCDRSSDSRMPTSDPYQPPKPV